MWDNVGTLRKLEVGFKVTQSSSLKKKPLERVTGIEPAYPAWKAGALPLSYTRVSRSDREEHCRRHD